MVVLLAFIHLEAIACPVLQIRINGQFLKTISNLALSVPM
jgi:hypothetical protein